MQLLQLVGTAIVTNALQACSLVTLGKNGTQRCTAHANHLSVTEMRVSFQI